MRNRHPPKPRAKAVRPSEAGEIDWLALWAISLGICAVVIAATAFFAAADQVGAALVLIGTAALMAIILKANEHGYL